MIDYTLESNLTCTELIQQLNIRVETFRIIKLLIGSHRVQEYRVVAEYVESREPEVNVDAYTKLTRSRPGNTSG